MIDFLKDEYKRFDTIVEAIKDGTSDAEYIGSGIQSRVWRATTDGADYAIKIAQELSPRGRPRDRQGATLRAAETAIKGLGIGGLEQICAISPEDGVAIYEFVQGTSLSELKLNDVTAATEDQLNALEETVRQATRVGIEFDGWNTSGANAIYSPENGFTLIDYWNAKSGISEKDNMKYALRSLGVAGIYFAGRMGFAKGEFTLKRATWD